MASEATDPSKQARSGRKRRRRRGIGLIAILAAAALAALLTGFLNFANRVTAETLPVDPPVADGIVVFTGGRDRIAVAAHLLADGKGRRLLISGVNPSTPRHALEDISPNIGTFSDCCIDLGRQAEDTIGNARETAAWANRHGFATLLVVTSAYHLPRSLTELESALPGVRLTGVPVTTRRLTRPWWRDRGVARLLVAEYTKYLASLVRLTMAGSER